MREGERKGGGRDGVGKAWHFKKYSVVYLD